VAAPELAALVEFAERPRTDDWSLRAALTRYAQPHPQRVGNLLELVRRIEFVLRPQVKALEKEGTDPSPALAGLFAAAAEIDRLGDLLAAWAADPTKERPDDAVDAVVADVTRRLDDLGVPREERQRPTRSRG
jgi:hypothetical protein